MRITYGYIMRRLLLFVVIAWLAASINFFIPRMAPGDPVTAVLNRMDQQGMYMQEHADLIEAYRQRFGLDEPLHMQYLSFLRNMMTFDLGYSLTYYPTPVLYLIMRSLPWSIALLSISVALTFTIGVSLGAVMGWRATPRAIRRFLPSITIFAAIPSYLMALVFIYVFVVGLRWFPSGRGHAYDIQVAFTWEFITNAAHHAVLPVASIVVVGLGGWALGMRGMMITITDEDYLILARAKGLSRARIFWRYAVRNAMLPQVTGLAMALAGVVSGSVLVESWFAYPGIGYTLYNAIRDTDYTLIQGITFVMVMATALAVLIIDLVYPWLDPRITYERK